MLADDLSTKISLDRFRRMALRLNNIVVHVLRANVRSMLGCEPWLRAILCEPLRPDQSTTLSEIFCQRQLLVGLSPVVGGYAVRRSMFYTLRHTKHWRIGVCSVLALGNVSHAYIRNSDVGEHLFC